MNFEQKRPHTVAILRGGDVCFSQSLSEGQEMLHNLTSKGFFVLDVLVDQNNGAWTMGGVPTDPHYIFTYASFVVDTTRTKGQNYQRLAKKMGVPLLFSHVDDMSLNREDTYRLLRQQGIPVPESTVVRSSQVNDYAKLHTIWNTHHTPLMLRPLHGVKSISSKIIRGFKDLVDTLEEYSLKKIDTQVLTYKKTPTYSIAVIPNFRNKEYYTPMWVSTSVHDSLVPHKNSYIEVCGTNTDMEKMIKTVEGACLLLGIHTPVCVDMTLADGKHTLVNIDTMPSLRRDGRFMKSLATTGIEIGEYINSYPYDSVR